MGEREVSETAFHSGKTVKKQGRVLGTVIYWEGLETGKEPLKLKKKKKKKVCYSGERGRNRDI